MDGAEMRLELLRLAVGDGALCYEAVLRAARAYEEYVFGLASFGAVLPPSIDEARRVRVAPPV